MPLQKTTFYALLLVSMNTFADQNLTDCVMKAYQSADENMTLAELREQCSAEKENNDDSQPTGLISQRILNERQTEFQPFVLTPHKMNYILPVYTTNEVNRAAYRSFQGYEENLEDAEAQFQLSFKIPLNHESLFKEGDGLYLGFTLQAWWQIYSSNLSKPFRETNYQPELFYLTPLDWHPLGGNTGLVLGIEHQSNGRGQNLSRSWNRVYANFLYEKNNFALSFKPWYRLPEDDKSFDLDPEGDDNPDIKDFMGHFELGMAYKWRQFEFTGMSRLNFKTDHGFIEFGMTFPLWGKLRGYLKANSGYGDSLIDYNHNQTRLGIGIALNDLL